ncbi:carboxypeptidase-like regulatory domain-containing protein [Flavobacterium columnare]|uniref:carboxypeptidase-like regulatory domain-containing protein n=1 Tax=Flavobacterium columnare TaxID=996 RepID=UPI004034DFA5
MKKLVFSTLLVLQAVLVFAQQPTGVSGKVIDYKTNKPLQNVVTTIENTNLSQLTNSDGKFSVKGVPVGKQLLKVKGDGYKEQLLSLEIIANQVLDLGVIVLEDDSQNQEQQLSLVTLTENDLSDDNSGSESTSGLLQATRDTYQQAAAFNWGGARFRIRGLDNEYGNTMINGVSMNKLFDGRPQWSNWGGLNDATRNQEFTMGSTASDYTFGSILGTQEINTRASLYRPGTRVSFSGTNTNYNWRAMGTHASGLDSKGWAFVVSASRRWAQEGHFEGTDMAANSLFASVEKRFGKKHVLNFTSIYAQNRRGRTSPNTNEVTDIKGYKYNSYWGWQEGKKRNSRDRIINEPIMMLNHYWKFNDKTRLNTNLAFQSGSIANARLEYPGGNNPDPTYYKKLPSTYLNLTNENTGAWIPDYARAANALADFKNNGQINWDEMYYANTNPNNVAGKAYYLLTEQRNDDTQITANSILNSQISENISINAGVNFKKLKSHQYAVVTDLLGAKYTENFDPFYVSKGNFAQFDLNNPNQKIYLNDIFGYSYNLRATVVDAFTQFKFNFKKADFYFSQTFSKSEYEREGLYKNGKYASNSFGKSERPTFENYGLKGGITFKLSSRHLLDFNGAFLTKAPNLRNTFANARYNNNVTIDLASEKIVSADASYIIRTPKFKSRITGFYNTVSNATNVAFFFGEGVADEDTNDGNEDAFVSEIVTGMNRKNIGGELGVEYQITSTIKASLAGSYGEYTYDNNPTLRVNNDAAATESNNYPIEDFGKTYLKGYRVGGMPQIAGSFGLEYRNPNFWYIGANYNYFDQTYVGVSNILRTNNFTIDDKTGISYDGVNETSVRKALQQERLPAYFLLNLNGGKSWRAKGGVTFGFFATVNNVLDKVFKTGGFEQSRKATFPLLNQDSQSGIRTFGSKYFYGYGRNFFVNLYVNF